MFGDLIPLKRRRNLQDILTLYFVKSKLRSKFVLYSHKTLPSIGVAIMAPPVNSLTEEVIFSKLTKPSLKFLRSSLRFAMPEDVED